MFVEKFLGQIRPADNSPYVIYTAPANKKGLIKTINIMNLNDSSLLYRSCSIYLDNSGNNIFTKDTALFYNITLIPASPFNFQTFWVIAPGGQLAVQSNSSSGPNNITFTIFGAEVDI